MTLAERNSGSKKLRDGERSHGLSRSVYTRLEYVFRQTPNLNFLDFILVEVLNLITEKFNPILV